MNYALFISPYHFGIISTSKLPGTTECQINGQTVTILVAPQEYVDKCLNIDPSNPAYFYQRNVARTDTQKKNAILTFFYGHTFTPVHTHEDICRETTDEVFSFESLSSLSR